MKKVDIQGRAIRDLNSLSARLEAAGFLVSHCEAAQGVLRSVDGAGPVLKGASKDALASGPYTRVWLHDTETKDPAAIVRAFADDQKGRAPKQALVESPNGTVWAVTVDDTGKIGAKRA